MTLTLTLTFFFFFSEHESRSIWSHVTMGKGKKKSKSGGGGEGGGGGGDAASDRPSPEDAVRDETLEQVQSRHAAELAAVREITAKFGKKEKDKALRMEGEVTDRHYLEMAAWEELDEERNPSSEPAKAPVEQPDSSDDENDDDAKKKKTTKDASAPSPPTDAMAKASIADGGGGDGGGPVMTKAMKRRMKKEAEEKEREARIEEEKANLGPSSRDHEEAALKRLLAPMGLRVKEIKADGHCMYRSVEDQLAQKPHVGGGVGGGGVDYASLRRRCAHVMRKNQWDYRPFLPQCAAADSAASDTAWEKYCADVEDSATWGGQMELGALAKALGRCIKVYSAHMPVVVMGEEFVSSGGEPLVVCYQQHAFGLGEHYNSVANGAPA